MQKLSFCLEKLAFFEERNTHYTEVILLLAKVNFLQVKGYLQCKKVIILFR